MVRFKNIVLQTFLIAFLFIMTKISCSLIYLQKQSQSIQDNKQSNLTNKQKLQQKNASTQQKNNTNPQISNKQQNKNSISTFVEQYQQLYPDSYQQFENVKLSHPLPSIFILGQTFILQGQVLQSRLIQYIIKKQQKQKLGSSISNQHYDLNIVLILDSDNDKDHDKGKQSRQRESKKFVIRKSISMLERKFMEQIQFVAAGRYRIGFLLGDEGLVGERQYLVVKDSLFWNRLQSKGLSCDPIQLEQNIQKPNQIKISVISNQVQISWPKSHPLTKLTLSQPNSPSSPSITHTVSNNSPNFMLPLHKFSSFSPHHEVLIQISHSNTIGLHLSAFFQCSEWVTVYKTAINVTQHYFMDVRDDLMYFKGPRDGVMGASRNFGDLYALCGVCYEDLIEDALVIRPDGKIVEFKIVSTKKKNGIIPSYNQFLLEFVLEQEGTYILQINHKLGFAVINTPIYVGKRYPLIPDEIDIQNGLAYTFHESPQSSIENLPTSNKKYFLLSQINQIRQLHSLPPLVSDSKLQNLAQCHSKDMNDRNFISHINPDKQNSKARANKVGIYEQIGENIIVGKGLELLQVRLNRSPLHLRNTLDTRWRRVGIGLAKGKNGEYYLTQEFATEEIVIKDEDIDRIKDEFILSYNQMSKQTIQQNKNLSSQLKKWHTKHSPQNLGNLKQILSNFNIKSISLVSMSISPSSNNYSKYKQQIKQNQNLKNVNRKNVGITVKYQKGMFRIVSIFY